MTMLEGATGFGLFGLIGVAIGYVMGRGAGLRSGRVLARAEMMQRRKGERGNG